MGTMHISSMPLKKQERLPLTAIIVCQFSPDQIQEKGTSNHVLPDQISRSLLPQRSAISQVKGQGTVNERPAIGSLPGPTDNCPTNYYNLDENGALRLPRRSATNGVIYRGEVYCRMPGCRDTTRYSHTDYLIYLIVSYADLS